MKFKYPKQKPGLLYPATNNDVDVCFFEESLALDEKETVISCLQSDTQAEVYTTEYRWMKTLEKLGHRPYAIYIYPTYEARIYLVPKAIIKIPKHRATSLKTLANYRTKQI